MTFENLIETAWNDHADRPQEVADRLASSLALIDSAQRIVPFARLVTHVFGEHLGQWRRGIEVLESLRGTPACDGSPASTSALARGIAVLRHTSGEHDALAPLSTEDRIAVLASAASAFAGRHEFRRAVAAYAEASRLAESGLPSGSPAIRALAIGGNNLAAALEEKGDRDAFETRGMIAAAEGGLKYWKQSGTWLEEERAEYRLARSLLQAGEPRAAVDSARRCIAVCAANDALAFEQFFGYAVLALAQRAAGDGNGFAASRREALDRFEQVASDEKAWCASALEELSG